MVKTEKPQSLSYSTLADMLSREECKKGDYSTFLGAVRFIVNRIITKKISFFFNFQGYRAKRRHILNGTGDEL
jgi:hypothetical protein